MRTATAAEIQGLDALHRVTRLYVDVWHADAWVDLTSLAGEQWVTAVEYRDQDESTTVPRATLRFHRETHERSLAPLVQDPPMLVAGALMRVRVAIWERGQTPTSPKELLEGRIEENGWGGNASELTLDIRETLMARIHHTFMTRDFTVGPGNIQEVIQEVLDEWTPGITLAIGSGNPADYTYPSEVTLREQTVESAVRQLAANAGWDLRRLEVAGVYELVLFEPVDPSKADPAPVHTYAPKDYYEVPQMGFSSIGMRDQVVVAGVVNNTEVRVTVSADAPLLGDDYRAFKLDETDNQLMATEAQLRTFGEKALLATARLPVATEVALPFDWRPELADWLRFTPNLVHHKANFDGAVTAVRHVIQPGASSDGGGTTTLSIRGSFGGHLQSWRERIRRTRLKDDIEDLTPDPDPDPVTPPGDAALYHTTKDGTQGFSLAGTRDESLGKYVSTTRVTDFGANDVFREITEGEVQAGITLYRGLGFANTDASCTTPSYRAYVPDAGEDADVDIRIGLDPAGIVDLEQAAAQGAEIGSETTAPSGVAFSAPPTVGSGLLIGEIPPRSVILVWVGMEITADASVPQTGGQFCIEVCMPSEPSP